MSDVEYLAEMAVRHRALPRPRLCYLEIPAVDVHASADFYEKVFGWDIRGRDTEYPSFAYPSADVTGGWVARRAISREPGLLPYIWVDDIAATFALIEASGGSIVEQPRPDSPGSSSRIATFRDPAGNVMGLHQEGRR